MIELSLPTVAIVFFTLGLSYLTYWDLKYQLLPTTSMQGLLWLGLFCNTQHWFCDCQSAIMGAMIGYLSLWCIAKTYYLITRKHGMGNGDFTLLATIGAWVGWQFLPLIILIASTLGSSVGLSLIFFKKQCCHRPIAFGPYLAMAGWLVLLIYLKPT